MLSFSTATHEMGFYVLLILFYYYLLCTDVWEGQLRRVKREALSISEQRGQCVRFSWSGGGICQSIRNDRVVCKGHGNYWWMRRALIGTEEKNQWMDDGCVWVCAVAWVCAYKYSGAKKYLVSHQLCKFSHLKRWERPVIIGIMHHRYTSTMRDKIRRKKSRKSHCRIF